MCNRRFSAEVRDREGVKFCLPGVVQDYRDGWSATGIHAGRSGRNV
jgi:hypothetical protein